MQVSIHPTEMHDFAGIYGATIAAFRTTLGEEFSEKETAYIAAVSLLGHTLEEKVLVAFARSLFSLLDKRVFLGIKGDEYPLPPYDPEAKESPLFFMGLDCLFALHGYYLYNQGKVGAPEEAIRPISFLLYEMWEGLKEGLEGLNPSYRPIFEAKCSEIEKDEDVALKWRAHLDAASSWLN